MARLLEIHPDNPQPRRIAEVASVLRVGGIIAYPSDSSYALGWHMGDQQASKINHLYLQPQRLLQ